MFVGSAWSHLFRLCRTPNTVIFLLLRGSQRRADSAARSGKKQIRQHRFHILFRRMRTQRVFSPDRDHDGHGDSRVSATLRCLPANGFVSATLGDDCNDDEPRSTEAHKIFVTESTTTATAWWTKTKRLRTTGRTSMVTATETATQR